MDYYAARGNIQAALDGLNINIVDKKLDNDDLLHPGQAVSMYVEGKYVGKFGKLHPKYLLKLGFDIPLFLFEFNLYI